ncbi:hypothetical protein VNO77_19631 [Canavalia gladiata]|uniref:Bulb-type lectin domain-containing protein n=1 Tax=Canavalia gladiata TaxID=3824 RepID=A0AAN9LMW2_CANGL
MNKEIRDEQYDEKTGTVTIRVICCNPEKLRDNLCREGGGFIKRIEIVQPPPSTPPSTPPTTPPSTPPTPPTPPPTIRDRPCLPPAFLVWPFYEDGSGGAPSFYEKRIWDSYDVSIAIDTITSSKFIKDPETITSRGGNYTLGFFSPENSTARYVGIWWQPLFTVIWVANRNQPLRDSYGIVTISEDGNFVVFVDNNV